MPLHMRMPKRGFNNIFANDFAEVNLGRLQKAIDDKQLDARGKITEEMLRKAGLAHKSRDGVRLLGKGELTAKIDIEVAGASAGAAAAVEKAGGTRHHHLQEDGLHEQEGRAGQAPEAPRRNRPKKRAARNGRLGWNPAMAGLSPCTLRNGGRRPGAI